MRVLTLRPGPRALGFAAFTSERGRPRVRGTLRLRTAADLGAALDEALAELLGEHLPERWQPELVVIRAAHDGHAFSGPTPVTEDGLAALRRAAAAAPLQLPPAIGAGEAVRRALSGVPALFVFESTFFLTLPARERTYALDRATRAALRAARSGFHGLFHAEAADAVARARDALGRGAPARVASVCLQGKPEIAGVLGHRPMVVTSGATPLEGLPGEHDSGEIDPGIVLALAQTQELGPDEINELLTHRSGLVALGADVGDLGAILTSVDPYTELARAVFAHRLLLACGAAAAALGGLDAVVFSGAHAAAGAALQGPLVRQLSLALAADAGAIDVFTLDLGLDQVLARAGVQAWREAGQDRRQQRPERVAMLQ